MKKLLTKLMLLSVLCFSGTVSAAIAPVDLGVLSSGAPLSFEGSHSAGDFTDAYTFTLLEAHQVAVELTDLAYAPGSFVLLSNTGLEATLDGNSGTSFITGLLAAADWTLFVNGDASGILGGAYSGSVTAVPLPAAFWMFGSALMGLFAFARRRNQHAKYA